MADQRNLCLLTKEEKVDYNSTTFFEKILQPVVIKAPMNLREKVQNQDQMHDTLNDDSMYATSSKEKQLNKSKNSDNKLLKKPIVKLEHLPHLMITKYVNRLSGIYNSFLTIY